MGIISEGEGEMGGAPLLAEFMPLSSLWEGENAPYPSEYSARWSVRSLGPELAKAGAVAVHRGRLLIHPQRFAQVAERLAIERATARFGRG